MHQVRVKNQNIKVLRQNRDRKGASSSTTNSGDANLQVIDQIVSPLSNAFDNLRDTVTDLKNTVRTISSMGVKATNNISGNVTPPKGSLRWYVNNALGTMTEVSPNRYQIIIGVGKPAYYVFKMVRCMRKKQMPSSVNL